MRILSEKILIKFGYDFHIMLPRYSKLKAMRLMPLDSFYQGFNIAIVRTPSDSSHKSIRNFNDYIKSIYLL